MRIKSDDSWTALPKGEERGGSHEGNFEMWLQWGSKTCLCHQEKEYKASQKIASLVEDNGQDTNKPFGQNPIFASAQSPSREISFSTALLQQQTGPLCCTGIESPPPLPLFPLSFFVFAQMVLSARFVYVFEIEPTPHTFFVIVFSCYRCHCCTRWEPQTEKKEKTVLCFLSFPFTHSLSSLAHGTQTLAQGPRRQK